MLKLNRFLKEQNVRFLLKKQKTKSKDSRILMVWIRKSSKYVIILLLFYKIEVGSKLD